MAKNLTGKQAGTVQGDSVNDPSVRVMRGKNLFPQSFRHPSTNRYGEVDAIASIRCERGDTIPYKFATDLNTYTLQSPIKSEVNMYTAAFKVPMQAIYPRNWEIMYPIPNKGDDVPEENRSVFSVGQFYTNLRVTLLAARTANNLDLYVRLVLLAEKVFSAGGLFAKFNMHLNAFRFADANGVQVSFDKWFDTVFIPKVKPFIMLAGTTGLTASLLPLDSSSGSPRYYVVADSDSRIGVFVSGSPSSSYINFRQALELLRFGEYYISVSGTPDLSTLPAISVASDGTSFNSLAINIEPIAAYQLSCAHFFSNSKIDYVYSAQLYRDNMQSLLYGDTLSLPTFVWNGIVKMYDVFSKVYLQQAISLLSSISVEDSETYNPVLGYFYNLFTFQRSLRYGDYFTAAHPEPIAPGDINAPVIDGSVNALDMTRKLQLTRLLNKVNISGPRIEDYLLALFGGKLPEAPKDVPIRLSLEKSSIEGFEVNNTGDAQLSESARNITTTNLRLTDSKYMFEASIDEPCWIIVTQYYDAERIYCKTLDRFAYHYDRFDDFIPDLQFEGDQDVKLQELDITRPDQPFAYNLRYMEYKNRYSYASGGFIEFLPSWAFITDNRDGALPSEHITPSYIRSNPSEFDRFYKSFASAYSLGSYFHFISFNTNVVNPQRQMVFAPEILA